MVIEFIMHINTVILITIIQLHFIKYSFSKCEWIQKNVNENCEIICENQNNNNFGHAISSIYEEKEHCKENGIEVEMKLSSNDESYTLSPNWITNLTNVKIVALTLECVYIYKIEVNAFDNCIAFHSIVSLQLTYSRVKEYVAGMFNGLQNLQNLFIHMVKMALVPIFIEFDLLQVIKDNLVNIKLSITGERFEIVPSKFFGGDTVLTKLQNIDFAQTNITKITSETLSGLIHIQFINFSSCYIQTIDDNAFDVIGNTIESFDLSRNELLTLSDKLFMNLLPNTDIKFYLYENPWLCDCNLYGFSLIIELYPENFIKVEELKCYPEPYKITAINFSVCITVPTTIATTTETTILPTTIITTEETTINDLEIELECLNYVNHLESEMLMTFSYNNKQNIDIVNELNNEIKIKIESIDFVNHIPVLVSIDYQNGSSSSNSNIECILLTVHTITITKIIEFDKPYMFCIMDKLEDVISPFNCISYNLVKPNNIWISQSSQITFICSVIIVSVMSMSIGAIIGYYLMKSRPELLEGSKGVVIVKTRLNRIYDRQITTRRSSYEYISNIYERLPFDSESMSGSFNGVYEEPMSQFDYIKHRLELQRNSIDDLKKQKPKKIYYDLEIVPKMVAPSTAETISVENNKPGENQME